MTQDSVSDIITACSSTVHTTSSDFFAICAILFKDWILVLRSLPRAVTRQALLACLYFAFLKQHDQNKCVELSPAFLAHVVAHAISGLRSSCWLGVGDWSYIPENIPGLYTLDDYFEVIVDAWSDCATIDFVL